MWHGDGKQRQLAGPRCRAQLLPPLRAKRLPRKPPLSIRVEIYTRDRIAPEKGGGNWRRIFDGSFTDLALTPQHWNVYATQGKQ